MTRRMAFGCLTMVALAGASRLAPAAEENVVVVREATGSRDPGARCVDDPDALDGKALHFPASDQVYFRWYSFGGGATVLAGDYEVRFRLKVDDNAYDKPIFHLYGGETHFQVKGTGFWAAGAYQEFTIPCVTAPGQWKTWIRSNLRKLPGPPAWVDRIAIVCKRRLTEAETLAAAGFRRLPDPRRVPHDGLRVWFVKGLYYEHYRILEALRAMDAEIDFAWTPRPPSGLDGLPLDGRPKPLTGEAAKAKEAEDSLAEANRLKPDDTDPLSEAPDKEAALELESEEERAAKRAAQEQQAIYAQAMSYDLTVLCNVEADNLSLAQRALIQDAVKAGTGLLLIGGPFAFGRGNWPGSDMLSDLLPLTPTGNRDLQPLPTFEPLTARADGPFAKLLGGKAPSVRWVHRGTPKPDAAVELRAGKVPVLLMRDYGRGRIAMLAGTVLGEPPVGQVSFWDWPGWPELMKQVVQRLLPQEEAK